MVGLAGAACYTPPVSRYQLFRRRIAPIAFILAMGLLIRESCQGQERTRATIVLELGDAAAQVRQIDAELIVDGDVIGTFHRKALPGRPIGESKFETSMPTRDAKLQIDVDLGATQRRLVRSVHVAEDGATVRVPLASDLAP